ncbi:hypothetical protein BT69DRAFT_356469 [Atractiella rhizophila]|nr:hypothetical protein BT69DRAFT_356469 [Atractiella rhizophila]
MVGLGITSDEAVEKADDGQRVSAQRRRGWSLSQTGGMTALDMRRASIRGGLSQPQLKTLQARLEKAEEQALGKSGYIPVPSSNLQPLLSPFVEMPNEKEYDFPPTIPRKALARSNTNPHTTTLSTLSSESQRLSSYSGNSYEPSYTSSREHHADGETDDDDDIDPYPPIDHLPNIDTENYSLEVPVLKHGVIKAEPTAVVVAEEGRAVIADKSGESLFGVRLTDGTTHLLLRHTQTPDLVIPCLMDAIPLITQTLLVLDISSCQLLEVPKILSSCQALEELNVSSNPLDCLPSFLNRITSLRVLMADKCGLITLYNDLSDLQNLHTISLNDNALRALPAWLCQLASLEHLFLDGNAFQSEWQKLIRPVLLRRDERSNSTNTDFASFPSSNTMSSASSISDGSISQGEQSPPPSSGYLEKPASPARSRLMSFGRAKARPELPSVASSPSIERMPAPQPKRMRSYGDMDLNLSTSSVGSSPRESMIEVNSQLSSGANSPIAPSASIRSLNNSIPSTPSPLASVQPITFEGDEGDKDGKKRKWGFLKKMSMTTMNKHPEPRSARPHRHNDEGRTASDSSSSYPRSARGNGSLLGRPRAGNRNSQLIVEETKTLNKRRSFLLLHNNTRAVTPEPATPDASSDSNVVDYKAGLKAIIAYLQDLNDLTPAPGGPVHRNTQASASSPNLSALASGNASQPLLRNPSSRRGTDAMGSFDSSGRSTPTPNEIQKEPAIKCKEDAARREKILEEVLSSERTYLRQLKEMVDIYVKEAEKEVAVSSTGKKEPVVPIAERRTIFGNIDNIIHFHESVFLPNLESAVEILFIKRKAGDTVDTAFIRFMADQVARVFTQHSAFFKLYAPYINNFDLALSRLKAWNAPKSPPPPTSSSSYSMAKSVSSMGAAVSLGMSGITEQNSSMPLSESQKKRLKGYLKKCKADPRHTQVSLESYLLLPVQRIPRYKLLLENLLSCTPVDNKSLMPDPVIKEAADIIAEITADMNERKRESESRHRLLFWQQRIRNRFRSPLVQPHRRMMKEGTVVLMRVLKRRSQYVDVGQQSSAGDVNSNSGTLPSGERSLIQVNSLEVETETRRLIALLCSDILVLCKEPEDGMDGTGPVDLYTVIRLSPTPGVKSVPASMFGPAGSMIRLVDSRAILYLSCPSHAEALTWVESINLQMQS